MASSHLGSSRPPLEASARPDLAESLKQSFRQLGAWRNADQLPIVYDSAYNVKFFGIEKLHPFDSAKFEKVKISLQQEGLLKARQLVRPFEASREVLSDVHTSNYLDLLAHSSQKVAEVICLPIVGLLPKFLVQSRVHKSMKYHVGGTILAAGLAVECGWAINLGGGMHHAHAEDGDGWCMYNDWMLAIRRLRKATDGRVQKALYVDLDVHQGNGVARDKMRFKDSDFYILDMYNREIWPNDRQARQGIDNEVTICCGCEDEEYLQRLQAALRHAFASFKPDIMLYNAGTDILVGDPLGHCKISREGVIQRDEIVWQAAVEHQVPICMALSGGYAKANAAVVAACISNLIRKFELTRCLEADERE